jgi:hypothetical protein
VCFTLIFGPLIAIVNHGALASKNLLDEINVKFGNLTTHEQFEKKLVVLVMADP